MFSFMSCQFTSLFQFRAHESTIIYVIVDSYPLIWNKLFNSDDVDKHILFQLGDLIVCAFFKILRQRLIET